VCFLVDASGSISWWIPPEDQQPPPPPSWFTKSGFHNVWWEHTDGSKLDPDDSWGNYWTMNSAGEPTANNMTNLGWTAFMKAMAEHEIEDDSITVKSWEYGWEAWAASKYFVASLVNRLEVSENGTNVALVHFSSEESVDAMTFGDPHINAGEENFGVGQEVMSWNTHDIMDKISKMPYEGSTTATAVGMAKCADVLSAGRPDANQVIVILTDGEPTHPRRVDEKAKELQDQGMQLLWVTVDWQHKGIQKTFEKECPVDGGEGIGEVYPRAENPDGRRCWPSEPTYDYMYPKFSYYDLVQGGDAERELYDRLTLAICPAVAHVPGWFCDEEAARPLSGHGARKRFTRS